MDLLRDSNAKYDGYQAMVMTQMYDFRPGILYLFEKTKQYQQIVRYYMEKKAYSGANVRGPHARTRLFFVCMLC